MSLILSVALQRSSKTNSMPFIAYWSAQDGIHSPDSPTPCLDSEEKCRSIAFYLVLTPLSNFWMGGPETAGRGTLPEPERKSWKPAARLWRNGCIGTLASVYSSLDNGRRISSWAQGEQVRKGVPSLTASRFETVEPQSRETPTSRWRFTNHGDGHEAVPSRFPSSDHRCN